MGKLVKQEQRRKGGVLRWMADCVANYPCSRVDRSLDRVLRGRSSSGECWGAAGESKEAELESILGGPGVEADGAGTPGSPDVEPGESKEAGEVGGQLGSTGVGLS